ILPGGMSQEEALQGLTPTSIMDSIKGTRVGKLLEAPAETLVRRGVQPVQEAIEDLRLNIRNLLDEGPTTSRGPGSPSGPVDGPDENWILPESIIDNAEESVGPLLRRALERADDFSISETMLGVPIER